jgi:uncharacterized protein involved in response to NO
MTTLLHPAGPATPPRGTALFALGFRPFYLLAAVQAALSVGLWSLQATGLLATPVLAGPLWHGHEMLFGFTLAVVVGFLLTAGSNWTGLPTARGRPLAALALLWVAARLLVPSPWPLASAAANVAFPLAAAATLAVPFARARNRRNDFFVGLLVLLAAATGAIHAGALGWSAWPAPAALRLALDVMLFILVVMGGRVIPMFTNNAVPGARARRNDALERLALGSVLALLAAGQLPLPAWALAALAAVAAAAHLARWALWQPWRTLEVPLVWALHLAYLWIPVHLGLRAAGALGWTPPSLAVHALTTGAIGGLVIAMVTRTAKGHTGRPLRADRWDVACYLLVALAALVRVAGPLLAPAWTLQALRGSGALWAAGFALYAVRYAPWLVRPRLDGRPG